MRSVFGWDLPPGVTTSMLPGNEPQPPCCEECPEEVFEKCPGMNKCLDVYISSSPMCCLKHRIEGFDGYCCECEADNWREQTRWNFYTGFESFDTSKPNIRAMLLRSGVHIKDIEKEYLKERFISIFNIEVYDPNAFAGIVHELGIAINL